MKFANKETPPVISCLVGDSLHIYDFYDYIKLPLISTDPKLTQILIILLMILFSSEGCLSSDKFSNIMVNLYFCLYVNIISFYFPQTTLSTSRHLIFSLKYKCTSNLSMLT